MRLILYINSGTELKFRVERWIKLSCVWSTSSALNPCHSGFAVPAILYTGHQYTCFQWHYIVDSPEFYCGAAAGTWHQHFVSRRGPTHCSIKYFLTLSADCFGSINRWESRRSPPKKFWASSKSKFMHIVWGRKGLHFNSDNARQKGRGSKIKTTYLLNEHQVC